MRTGLFLVDIGVFSVDIPVMRAGAGGIHGRVRTFGLYARALVYEFRWTLLLLAVVLCWGTVVYILSPNEFQNKRPTVADAFFATWMAMLGQPIRSPPEPWQLKILCMAYPIIGFVVIGEGVVRLAILMFSRRHGREEWMKVMASTYRNHVVVCGVGRMGIRVLEQLVAAKVPAVAIEKDPAGRFLPQARDWNVPVIVGDMKDDATLISAGIAHASVVVIATNDDMANIEVALDSRRMNPEIRVVMRLFEQSIAQKMANAFLVDVAFSATTLAAPMVAAMSLGARTVSTSVIAGIPHVTAEIPARPESGLCGKRVDEIEAMWPCKVLALAPAAGPIRLPPTPGDTVSPGDTITIHTASAQLATIAAAADG